MSDSAALGALVVAVIVLSATILLGYVLFARAANTWERERTALLNRVLAENTREFAHLQKATALPSDREPDPVRVEPNMIGT